MTAPEICPLKSSGAKPQQRVDEIDFWRGLALIIIFINHFQGNVVSFVTPKIMASPTLQKRLYFYRDSLRL